MKTIDQPATTIHHRIEAIEAALDEQRYQVGSWQKLIEHVETLGGEEKAYISTTISKLSNTLHQRHGFPRFPFVAGLLVELALVAFGTNILLAGSNSVVALLAASLALILSMQPFLKILTGLLLGVRYAYVFLFYIEPRFKMQYGTYISLSAIQRIIYHGSGVIGTPLALLLAILMFEGHDSIVFWGWILFWGAVALQAVPFFAELMGVRKVGPFRLALLTGAATMATEMKKLFMR